MLELEIEVDHEQFKKQKGKEYSDISDHITDNAITDNDQSDNNLSDNSQKYHKEVSSPTFGKSINNQLE